jgi:penicillin G amidase
MRIVPLIISVVISVGLIICLDRQWGSLPPIGRFLSPQEGFWQNAEPLGNDLNASIELPQLKDRGKVYFDDRLIPHIFANNEEDAYFMEGYLHAKFRLWQMEFQVLAAGGRLSEILGPGAGNVYLNHDREMRRLGMLYGAEKGLLEIEKDPTTKKDCDAYTSGVNAYISNLKESELPLEYKLLNYKPELWSNAKIALFMKSMSYELAGSDEDFEMTNAKAIFSKEDFSKLYPPIQDSVDPVVPKGTVFPAPRLQLKVPATVDSLYLNNKDTVTVREFKPEKNNGSNNWAVNGKKSKSGRPILCNDPHLGTNLPAIWYELQIRTNEFNDYGVSFPGAPYVVIGFNDSCAWGLTNAGRDVRDYYEIHFKDSTKKEYRFNGHWQQAEQRIEAIKIRDQPTFYDTVAYTVFGPVIYDNTYTGSSKIHSDRYYSVRWKANDASNELAVFSHLRNAKNYLDFQEAVQYLHNPGQNFIFASKAGDIAIRQQGEFPAKWDQQGKFVMPGTDSSYMWQGNIPQEENPFLFNPERGFVSSANQAPADTAYPYFLDNNYPIYRGLIINRLLKQMDTITPQAMMGLQTENYDVFAEMAKPLLLRNLDEFSLTKRERKYLNIFKSWNLRNDPEEKGPTVFKIWWDNIEKGIYDDEFSTIDLPIQRPYESTLLEALLKDSAYKFVDNILTPEKETLPDIITAAFKKSISSLMIAENIDRLDWAKYKDTWARHLLRIPALSRMHLPIGGGTHCINAAKQFHGPSWRMVVHLLDKTEAYGIYPGGQSGNPGSPFYDTFIDNWAAGGYYPLWVMRSDEFNDKKVRWKMEFNRISN